MAIPWGRCRGGGRDGKISNQDENTKSLRYSLGRKILLQKLQGSLCFADNWVSLPRLSLMTMKRPLGICMPQTPTCCSSTYFHFRSSLSSCRQKTWGKSNQPSHLAVRRIPGLSLQLPDTLMGHLRWDNWDTALDAPGALSGIKPQPPEMWGLHLGTCLPFIY